MNIPKNLETFAVACQDAAKQAGDLILNWRSRFTVKEKGPSDLVTEADLASQELIRQCLLGRFPDHGFLAEEDASIPAGKDGYRWVVDPIDGTTNYVHGAPGYCISIALEQRGEVLVGGVYDPVERSMFFAVKGGGATLNSRPIRASRIRKLSQALVSHSFPAGVQRHDPEVAEFLAILQSAQGTRRLGSSALNLCYTACGRFDAYWSGSTKPWDIAAGVLIVREAGGTISRLCGSEFDLEHADIASAATAELHGEILSVLKSANPATQDLDTSR